MASGRRLRHTVQTSCKRWRASQKMMMTAKRNRARLISTKLLKTQLNKNDSMMKIQNQKEDVFTRMLSESTMPRAQHKTRMLLIVKFQIHPVMNFIVHQLNVISEWGGRNGYQRERGEEEDFIIGSIIVNFPKQTKRALVITILNPNCQFNDRLEA